MIDSSLHNVLEITYASMLAVGVALYLIYFAFNLHKITLFDVAIIYFGLFFSLSPFITISNGGQLSDATTSTITMAYLSIVVFLFGIWLVKFIFFKPNKHNDFYQVLISVAKASIKYRQITLILFLLSFGTTMAIRSIYGFYAYGLNENTNFTIPYFSVVLLFFTNQFNTTFFIISILNISYYRKISFPYFYIFLVFIITNFHSRGYLMGAGFSLFLAYILTNRQVGLKLALFSSVLAFLMLSFVFPFIKGFRTNYKNLDFETKKNFVKSYYSAYQKTITDDFDSFKEDNSKNLSFRTYFVGQNIAYMKLTQIMDHTYGGLFWSNFLLSVPRALLGEAKEKASAETYLREKYFAGEWSDQSDNLIMYGWVEMGLLGVFITALFFAGIIRVLSYFAIILKQYYLFAAAILGALFLLPFQTESHYQALLLIMRFGLILVLIKLVLFDILKVSALFKNESGK